MSIAEFVYDKGIAFERWSFNSCRYAMVDGHEVHEANGGSHPLGPLGHTCWTANNIK